MVWFVRVSFAVFAIWAIVLGLLLLGYRHSLECASDECAGEFIGWIIYAGTWAYAGYVLIPVGLVSGCILVIRWIMRRLAS